MKRILRSSARVCKNLHRSSCYVYPAGTHFSTASCLQVRSICYDHAAPFRKIVITRKSPRTMFNAYVVGKEGAPGIVVLQEWWGFDFQIRNHALKISQMDPGFKVLVPDLYRGKIGLYVAEELHQMDGLDWKTAVKDIEASVSWLKADGSFKVGVTGFCMGGALSIASSVLIPQVDAAVSFYGVPSYRFADPLMAKAPVQAHFGELDTIVGFSDITAAKSLEEKLSGSGTQFEVHMYGNNGHAFMNRSEAECVRKKKDMEVANEGEDAVQLAWSRFRSWMTRYLCSSSNNH